MIDGILKTDTILDKIIAHKRGEVAAAETARPLGDLKSICPDMPPTRDFLAALQKETVALIAEVKHASPSKGVLIDPFDPVAIATLYAQNGAAAISVLTDEKFFWGHLGDLEQIRAAVDLPLLRKEFTISPYQIYEARAAGADAILLIVSTLDDDLLADLHALANDLGLAALVEVHDEREMERALRLNLPLIGINNRDLRTFKVDLNITRRLGRMVPLGTILVGESGIKTAEDVRALGKVHAVLVGETVVTAADRVGKLRELSSVKRG
jgi:indole-3-glycerol phosphate synthase